MYTPLAYTKELKKAPVSLVEMPEFSRRASGLLSEEELRKLVFSIGSNPESGDVMPETGGVRKLRWAIEGKGKSGGLRVIYYYHNETMPILLLTVYPKSEKDNLTREQKNTLKKLVPVLVKTYQQRVK
jgi:hypothetical protein